MDYSKIKLPCTLQRIIDGDTIIVTIDHLLEIYSKNAKIRFANINAPERKTPEGKISKSVLEAKLAGQELMISFTKIRSKVDGEKTKLDKYGRYLATLWIGDRNINEEMVAEGFAILTK